MLKNRLVAAWDQVRTSLWLLPLLMVVAGGGLAWAMLAVDAGRGAVRALSPGVNDPFTAVAVIDRLRGCLTRLTGRRLPSRMLCDGAGRVRQLRETTTFAGVTDAAFHQIRQAGASQPAVIIHLLEAIARIAEHARTVEQRGALVRHARMAAEAGLRDAAEPADRRDIERSLARMEQALADGQAPEQSAGQATRPARPALEAQAGLTTSHGFSASLPSS